MRPTNMEYIGYANPHTIDSVRARALSSILWNDDLCFHIYKVEYFKRAILAAWRFHNQNESQRVWFQKYAWDDLLYLLFNNSNQICVRLSTQRMNVPKHFSWNLTKMLPARALSATIEAFMILQFIHWKLNKISSGPLGRPSIVH